MICVDKPGKLSESVELSLTVGNARKLKCLFVRQTPSESIITIKSSFSFHILEEKGKILMTEQLEVSFNALGVFAVRIVLYQLERLLAFRFLQSLTHILDSFIYSTNSYWVFIICTLCIYLFCIILPLFMARHVLFQYYTTHHPILKVPVYKSLPYLRRHKNYIFFTVVLILCIVQCQAFRKFLTNTC